MHLENFQAYHAMKLNWASFYCIAKILFFLEIRCNPERFVLENGNVDCSDGDKLGSICSFSCNNGYTLSSGSPATTCMDENDREGQWSNPPPSCVCKLFSEIFDKIGLLEVDLLGNLPVPAISIDIFAKSILVLVVML